MLGAAGAQALACFNSPKAGHLQPAQLVRHTKAMQPDFGGLQEHASCTTASVWQTQKLTSSV